MIHSHSLSHHDDTLAVVPLHVRDIQWNEHRHSITIGQLIIPFTPPEYRLLFALHEGVPVTYQQLAIRAYNYTINENVFAMLEKHIKCIRGKIRGSGVYVYCVLGYGYILLPSPT